MSIKHIALFGGAFDPITYGHINICNYLVDNKIIDEVWIIPCYVSYHGKKMSHWSDRLYMCHLAVLHNNNDKIKVCDYEIVNKLNEETYDIVIKIVSNYNMYKFYFVIGLDNAVSINTWTNWNKLINQIPFIILPRILKNNDKIDTNMWFNKKPHIYLDKYIVDDISSTCVRENIKKHNYSNMIHKSINEYIIENKLYLS